MRCRSVLLAILVAAAGCAHSPSPAPEPAAFRAPEHFTGRDDSEPNSLAPEPEWWRDLGYTDLPVLVDEMTAQQPSLAAARARLEQASAIVGIAGASRWPQLSADLTAGRQRLRTAGQIVRQNFHELSVDLAWELDVWGRNATEERASQFDLEAVAADYDAALLSLTGRTVRAYLELLATTQQLDIARSSVTAIDGITERVRERYLTGLRRALDLRLAEADLANARSRLSEQEGLIDLRQRQLEVLVGRYPAGAIEVESAFRSLPPLPGLLPAELLARRPDIARARRLLWSSDLRHQVAEIDLLPRLVLGANAGTAAEQLEDLFRRDFGFWNFFGSLSAPLFQGGRLRAEANRALAARDEAAANYLSAVLEAYGEVESLLASDLHLRRREAALERAVTESRAALTISEERYFGGLIDILDLLAARQRYFDARSNAVRTRLERHLNHVNLVLALGGGYEDAPPQEPTDE